MHSTCTVKYIIFPFLGVCTWNANQDQICSSFPFSIALVLFFVVPPPPSIRWRQPKYKILFVKLQSGTHQWAHWRDGIHRFPFALSSPTSTPLASLSHFPVVCSSLEYSSRTSTMNDDTVYVLVSLCIYCPRSMRSRCVLNNILHHSITLEYGMHHGTPYVRVQCACAPIVLFPYVWDEKVCVECRSDAILCHSIQYYKYHGLQ